MSVETLETPMVGEDAPPEQIVAGAKTINGDGWTLALNPGWSIQPDPSRPRSFLVVKD